MIAGSNCRRAVSLVSGRAWGGGDWMRRRGRRATGRSARCPLPVPINEVRGEAELGPAKPPRFVGVAAVELAAHAGLPPITGLTTSTPPTHLILWGHWP